MPRPFNPLGRELQLYHQHHDRARRRGIEWGFTFETWHQVWKASGHAHERGVKRGQYVMARRGDKGPYTPGNVTIKMTGENGAEAHETAPFLERRNVIGRLGTGLAGGKGYSFDPSHPVTPWRAGFRNKNLGRFATEKQARSAYVKAATEYLTSHGKPIPDALKD